MYGTVNLRLRTRTAVSLIIFYCVVLCLGQEWPFTKPGDHLWKILDFCSVTKDNASLRTIKYLTTYARRGNSNISRCMWSDLRTQLIFLLFLLHAVRAKMFKTISWAFWTLCGVCILNIRPVQVAGGPWWVLVQTAQSIVKKIRYFLLLYALWRSFAKLSWEVIKN